MTTVSEKWEQAITDLRNCFWTMETQDFYDDNFSNNDKIQALSILVQELDKFNKEMQKKYADYCLDVLHADIEIEELKEQTNDN